MTSVPTTPNEGDPQGTEGQDRESYTDTQDRENYTVEGEELLNELDDLASEYADAMAAPLDLTPEDEERISGLIEGSGVAGETKDFTRPAFILSEVDTNHPSGRGLVLGWDTCGECHMHIRICRCVNGPHRPRYVETWRQQNEAANARVAERAAEREARAARVEADPIEVEARVQEVLEDKTPTGRKKRSDAGKPRGSRKKADATPESVVEAAGDLSAAMKDS